MAVLVSVSRLRGASDTYISSIICFVNCHFKLHFLENIRNVQVFQCTAATVGSHWCILSTVYGLVVVW